MARMHTDKTGDFFICICENLCDPFFHPCTKYFMFLSAVICRICVISVLLEKAPEFPLFSL